MDEKYEIVVGDQITISALEDQPVQGELLAIRWNEGEVAYHVLNEQEICVVIGNIVVSKELE